ncbi:MAG: hypothetical protein ACRDQH_04680 [Pseudonocardiaceae bacterium]
MGLPRKQAPNTISDQEWRKPQDRAARHETQHGGMLSKEATARRKAHDPHKAGSN